MTTTFDPAAHPRAHGGQFTEKVNDAPTGDLTVPTGPTASEASAAEAAMRAFIDRHKLADEDNPDERPVDTIGWALGTKVDYHAVQDLVIEAQRATLTGARANAIRAAAALWGESTEIPVWDENSVDSTPAGEYLRGQLETIVDTFGGDRETVYAEMRALLEGGQW